MNGPFQASRGFGVTFRGEGRAQVEQRFPTLRPWLDHVLGAPALREITPWWKWKLEGVPNAWYLNVLLVSPGGTVGRHVDATLRGPSGEAEAIPRLVSVLYLTVPRAKGGALQLWAGDESRGHIKPKENEVVHFRGDLAHEVFAFEEGPDPLRASLVIEQYHFRDEALAKLPEFKLESRAGFGAYLQHHAQRSQP